jgi:hypothetical protein
MRLRLKWSLALAPERDENTFGVVERRLEPVAMWRVESTLLSHVSDVSMMLRNALEGTRSGYYLGLAWCADLSLGCPQSYQTVSEMVRPACRFARSQSEPLLGAALDVGGVLHRLHHFTFV